LYERFVNKAQIVCGVQLQLLIFINSLSGIVMSVFCAALAPTAGGICLRDI